MAIAIVVSEPTPLSNGYSATVVMGTSVATHNGFINRDKADRWTDRIAAKMVKYEQFVKKHAGRHEYDS